MKGAKGFTTRRSSEDELTRARKHIKNVIVLMMENRSFDHLLGYLDHPSSEFPHLGQERFDNPFKLPKSEPFTPVSPDAEHRLAFDPPHGHLAAKMAMNGTRWRNFKMNGFVAAYAQKLIGKEPIAVVHWKRVTALGIVLSPVVAAGLQDLARLGVNGGWSEVLGWGGAGLAAAELLVEVVQLHSLPGRSRRQLVLPVVAGGMASGLCAHGLWRWSTKSSRGALPWTMVVAAGMGWLVLGAGRRLMQRARVPADELQQFSAKIMSCMAPDKVPVLGMLAKRFATCTNWHSSVPGATWPNRNFAHAATSEGAVDIEAGFYGETTIFQRLDEAHPPDTTSNAPYTTWRIYHHDTPQVVAFDALWKDGLAKNWFTISKLFDDIQDGTLPMYSFVEPCHTGDESNSQHPGNNQRNGDDFGRGELLMGDIYNALAAKKDVFDQTLLVITYDEHGGLFDHVAPPPSVHPEARVRDRREKGSLARQIISFFVENRRSRFDFRSLGPRVPAVIVSPRVPAGKIDATVYEHASIPASVRLLFAPALPPLKRRDAVASDFLHLVTDEVAVVPPPPKGYSRPDRTTRNPEEAAVNEAAPGPPAEIGDDLHRQLGALRVKVRTVLGVPETDSGQPGPVPTAALFQEHAKEQRNS
ncbi:MAG: hypothetical protein M3011_11540 [Actinomycetota bacterium]|nr:hypothetical protein [Actinomycetota bacterium]